MKVLPLLCLLSWHFSLKPQASTQVSHGSLSIYGNHSNSEVRDSSTPYSKDVVVPASNSIPRPPTSILSTTADSSFSFNHYHARTSTRPCEVVAFDPPGRCNPRACTAAIHTYHPKLACNRPTGGRCVSRGFQIEKFDSICGHCRCMAKTKARKRRKTAIGRETTRSKQQIKDDSEAVDQEFLDFVEELFSNNG